MEDTLKVIKSLLAGITARERVLQYIALPEAKRRQYQCEISAYREIVKQLKTYFEMS